MPITETVVNPHAKAALRAYRRHSSVFLATGALLCATGYVVLWVAGFPEDGAASDVAIWCFGLGGVPVLVGLGSLVHSLRMAACFRRYAWVELPVRLSLDSWGGNPILALGGEGEHVLFLRAIRQRWDSFTHLDRVLFSGRPDRRGVVSTPDGLRLAWVRRPRGAWHRRWLAAKVVRLSRREHAAPEQGGATTGPPLG